MSEISNVGPFESGAGEYDRWYDAHPDIFAGEVSALRECLGASGGKILEIGVGTGRFAAALGTRYGLDPSPAMLAIAAQRNIIVSRGVGERLPFASGSFDTVLLVTTLCFVRDREAVLLEAGRVLKEGESWCSVSSTGPAHSGDGIRPGKTTAVITARRPSSPPRR